MSEVEQHTPTSPKGLVWIKKYQGYAIGAASFAVIIIVWQLIAMTQPAYVFPSLGQVFSDILRFAEDGDLLKATLATAKSVALGAVASLVIGTIFGFALGRYEAFTAPMLNFVQTVPYVVWALMSMIWFGLSQFAVVFTIFIAGFTVISYNVAAGLKQVDQNLLGMAQSVRANRYMIFRHIVLPSLTPYLVSAARTTLGICWKIVVLAELFAGGGGGGGVGYNLYVSWEFNRPNEVFAWTVWLVILMMLTEWLVIMPVESFANRWKKN
ncbi:MAG: ABC transporter permease subunit [Rhodocyclaceae bacterium]|nr:MAG: ABC transporter permease subunit [Rhodocyclaceae bacterium]